MAQGPGMVTLGVPERGWLLPYNTHSCTLTFKHVQLHSQKYRQSVCRSPNQVADPWNRASQRTPGKDAVILGLAALLGVGGRLGQAPQPGIEGSGALASGASDGPWEFRC